MPLDAGWRNRGSTTTSTSGHILYVIEPYRDPVDALALRGVPVVGRGSVSGAIRGTQPESVLGLDD